MKPCAAIPIVLLTLLSGCAAPPPAAPPLPPPVVLMTDFGLRDDAVGLMRGVVLSIAPRAALVDLTHEAPRFEVDEASRLLAEAPGVYPPGTVFVAVIDPGVGTARRAIVARLANGSLVVAPDNGLISDVARRHGPVEVREVTNARLVLPTPSATFHGRDVFAPVGGHLAAGTPFEAVGPPVPDWVRLERPEPTRAGGVLTGRVVAIDEPFGNVWTDIPGAWAADLGLEPGARARVELGGAELVVPLARTFGDVPEGQPLLYVNSRGTLALAINMGDFARARKVDRGAPVRVVPLERRAE